MEARGGNSSFPRQRLLALIQKNGWCSEGELPLPYPAIELPGTGRPRGTCACTTARPGRCEGILGNRTVRWKSKRFGRSRNIARVGRFPVMKPFPRPYFGPARAGGKREMMESGIPRRKLIRMAGQSITTCIRPRRPAACTVTRRFHGNAGVALAPSPRFGCKITTRADSYQEA